MEKSVDNLSVDNIKGTKKNDRIKEVFFFGLSFLLPVVLMALIWGSIGITYNGQVTPLIYDMEVQYMPYLASLRYVLSGENSLFFTWGNALGGNYYGLMAYYMASPLSWITVLFDVNDMPNAIYVLTLLKIGLCGLTFSLFTRFGLSDRKCNFANVIFSSCYALMSYNVMYSMCVMWLDGVILLPLVLLGVERLVKGKKGFLYLGAIWMSLVFNYYTAYFVGLFSALYIVCRVLTCFSRQEAKKGFGVLVRYGVLSVLAIGMSMPLILPAYKSVAARMATSSTQLSTYFIGAYEFGFLQLLKKILPGQYDYIDNKGLPSIYCGSIMAVFALVYLFQKKHSIKEKISYLLMLSLFLLGFFNHYVDKAFHVFQYPVCFPYRYAFLFSAVILIMAWRAYEQISKDTSFKRLLLGIGAGYLCVELFFNGTAIVTGLHKEIGYCVKSLFDMRVQFCQPLIEELKEDEMFSRTEIACGESCWNYAKLFGVNSVTSFESTYNSNVKGFYYLLGSSVNNYFCTCAEELTPVGDSILGVKYRLDANETINGYEQISYSEVETMFATGKMYLHENKNALSLGYMVPTENIWNSEIVMSANPYSNQNILLGVLGADESEVFEEIPFTETVEDEMLTVNFVATSDKPVYFYVDGDRAPSFSEDVDSGLSVIIENKDVTQELFVHPMTNYCMGELEKGEEVQIRISLQDLVYYGFYLSEMDMQKYEEAIEQIGDEQLHVESYKGGNVIGNISVKEDGILFLTIPVDGGHRLKVDGEFSSYGQVLGCFMGVPLSAGEHTIEITYVAPGFEKGVRIGATAALLTIVFFALDIRKRRKAQGKEQESKLEAEAESVAEADTTENVSAIPTENT